MKKDAITYAALYRDGSYVERDTLEEAVNLSPFAILKIQWVRDHRTTYGNLYPYFHFKSIDKYGNLVPIRISHFEIVEIGPQQGTWENTGMKIKILDINEGDLREISVKDGTLNSFKNEIFPLIKSLNEFGSWDAYLNYVKQRETEQEILSLKNRIEWLENKIEELESENEKLESMNEALSSKINND